jgi:hypothetical protein
MNSTRGKFGQGDIPDEDEKDEPSKGETPAATVDEGDIASKCEHSS